MLKNKKIYLLYFLGVLTCILTIIFLIVNPTSTSAVSIKNNIVYTNDNTKAKIAIDNGKSGSILLIYEKSNNNYELQRNGKNLEYYSINENSKDVDIDIDLKSRKTKEIYAAIVNEKTDLSKYENLTNYDVENLNIQLTPIEIVLFNDKIIKCNEQPVNGYYLGKVTFNLICPSNIENDNIKLQWKCNDEDWRDYKDYNEKDIDEINKQIVVDKNCRLYARFVDSNGVESAEEYYDINSILDINSIEVDNKKIYSNINSNNPIEISFNMNENDKKKIGNNKIYMNCYMVNEETKNNKNLIYLASKEIDLNEEKLSTFFTFTRQSDNNSFVKVPYEQEKLIFIPETEKGYNRELTSIEYINKCGNIYFDEAAPKITDLSVENQYGIYVGKDIQLEIELDDVSKINLDAKISGNTVQLKQDEKNSRKYIVTVPTNITMEKNDGMRIDFEISDELGNTSYETKEINNKIDIKEPILSNLEFNKNGLNIEQGNKWVKNGDILNVKFELQDEQSGIDYKDKNSVKFFIGSQKDKLSEISDISYDSNTGKYNCNIKIGEDVKLDSQYIYYEVYGKDRIENILNEQKIVDIKFDSKKPECTDIKITKDDNTSLIKDGEKFKVQVFLKDEESGISDNSVKLTLENNKEIELQKEDVSKNIYSCEYTVNDNGQLNYLPRENTEIKISKLSFSDIAGNEEIITNFSYLDDNTDGVKISTNKIKYYRPIENLNEKVFSTNNSNKLSKNGDYLVIKFDFTHPVQVKNFKFENEDLLDDDENLIVTASNENLSYEIKYKIQGKTEDLNYINFSFVVFDDAFNKELTVNSDKDENKVKYMAPIVVRNIDVHTNNVNDGSKYAKNNDVYTISFETNHDTKISTVNTIKDKSAISIENDYVELSNSDYNSNYSIDKEINGEKINDCDIIPFEFYISDEASNDFVYVNNNSDIVKNRIQYYKPIEFSANVQVSGANGEYVKSGDYLSLDIIANHEIEPYSFNVSGINALGDNIGYSQNQNLRYLFSDSTSISEGEVSCNASFSDVAGNIKSMEALPRRIIFDKTLPTISLFPSFSGFTNKDIAFSTVYQDNNINPQAMSLLINSTEQFSDEDKNQAARNKSITKELSLTNEGEYFVRGTMTDMANNKCSSDIEAKIVIDKTNPNVTVSKINTEKTPAFKKGFIIGDYLNIDEKYLNSIVCKVSDSSGVNDFDVSEPLESDGKKTISIVAQDMAGNSSNEVQFDIYIDATDPKPIIKDEITDIDLDKESNSIFNTKANLSCSLKELNVGDEEADKFTTLQILDDNNNMVYDLLADKSEQQTVYNYMVDTIGKYRIKVQAVDSVGNETEELIYPFEVKEMNVVEEVYNNKPVFYIMISLIIVGVISIVFVGLIFNKKKKEKGDNTQVN